MLLHLHERYLQNALLDVGCMTCAGREHKARGGKAHQHRS
jgi:hypothetical protein